VKSSWKTCRIFRRCMLSHDSMSRKSWVITDDLCLKKTLCRKYMWTVNKARDCRETSQLATWQVTSAFNPTVGTIYLRDAYQDSRTAVCNTVRYNRYQSSWLSPPTCCCIRHSLHSPSLRLSSTKQCRGKSIQKSKKADSTITLYIAKLQQQPWRSRPTQCGFEAGWRIIVRRVFRRLST